MLPNPWIILVVVLAFVASNGFSFYEGDNYGTGKEIARENAKTIVEVKHVAKVNVQAQAAVAVAGVATAKKAATIHANIQKVKDDTDVQIKTADAAPAGCFLPPVLERVYDASGTGDGTYSADAGQQPDATDATIPCDLAAARFEENNETLRVAQAQVTGWNAAYAALVALYEKEFAAKSTAPSQ